MLFYFLSTFILGFSFPLFSFHEWPEHADLVVFVLLEVKPKLLTESELKEVIIKRFLGDADLLSSIFQRVTEQVAFVVVNSIVQFPPETDFLNDLLDGSFFGSFLLGLIWILNIELLGAILG